jgi:hypothetical protein
MDHEIHCVVSFEKVAPFTLRWASNGADFDPATLHNWPEFAPALKALADKWDSTKQATNRATT